MILKDKTYATFDNILKENGFRFDKSFMDKAIKREFIKVCEVIQQEKSTSISRF